MVAPRSADVLTWTKAEVHFEVRFGTLSALKNPIKIIMS